MTGLGYNRSVRLRRLQTEGRYRIVHVTSVHPPNDPRIFGKECAALARAGYDVYLVAPGTADRVVDDVKLVPLGARRGRPRRMVLGPWRALSRAWRLHADVYHLHDPELLVVAPFLRLRAKVIYDAHEDLPRQILSKPWIRPSLRRPLAAVAGVAGSILSSVCDLRVAATPTIQQHVLRPSILVRNYPDLGEFPAPSGERSLLPTIAYVGAVSDLRGAFDMAEAVRLLPRDVCATLKIAGPSDAEVIRRVVAILGDRLIYIPWLERAGVTELLHLAWVGLSLLHETPSYRDALPTKVFEYMAAGLPVIAYRTAVLEEIVESTGCGVLVEPGDVQAAARALETLLGDREMRDAMGRRGRTAATTRYSWKGESQTLLDGYARVLQARRGSGRRSI